MKRLFLPLLALGAAACQKTDIVPEPAICIFPNGGDTWRWVSSTGGLTGKQTETPASTGTTLTWQFRADSTVLVMRTRQGVAQPTDTLRYGLGTVRSIYTGQPARGLRLYRQGPAAFYVVQQWDTRLVLADNNPDGFTHTYER